METLEEHLIDVTEKEKVMQLHWKLEPLSETASAYESDSESAKANVLEEYKEADSKEIGEVEVVDDEVTYSKRSKLQMRISDIMHGNWRLQWEQDRSNLTGLLLQFSFVRIFLNFFQNMLLTVLQMGPIPQHVSFIMDGNRRYAKSLNLPLKRGHEAGSLTLLRTLHLCKRAGIDVASAYAFSIENFNRPKEEIDTLTEMLSKRLQELANRANNLNDRLYGAKLFVVGDRSLLSDELNDRITYVESITKHNSAFVIYICLPYTSRNDVYHSMYDIVRLVHDGLLDTKDITVELLTNAMYLGENSNKADILIRTSGHTRLSDYMLWQVHENSVIEFSQCMWPTFTFRIFYLILLKWSYFTTLQNARKQRMRDRVGTYARSLIAQKNVQAVSLDMLPPPPQAVSVTEKLK